MFGERQQKQLLLLLLFLLQYKLHVPSAHKVLVNCVSECYNTDRQLTTRGRGKIKKRRERPETGDLNVLSSLLSLLFASPAASVRAFGLNIAKTVHFTSHASGLKEYKRREKEKSKAVTTLAAAE